MFLNKVFWFTDAFIHESNLWNYRLDSKYHPLCSNWPPSIRTAHGLEILCNYLQEAQVIIYYPYFSTVQGLLLWLGCLSQWRRHLEPQGNHRSNIFFNCYLMIDIFSYFFIYIHYHRNLSVGLPRQMSMDFCGVEHWCLSPEEGGGNAIVIFYMGRLQPWGPKPLTLSCTLF